MGKSSCLPVDNARSQILRAISENHVTVLVGETGSGKTTKIPQFILDSGLLNDLQNHPSSKDSEMRAQNNTKKNPMIGVTQPRRVAAISIAGHVATQRKSDEVGYCVRFDDTCTAQTRIKFMTDGILLREIHSDPLLLKYGVIILDEAHERSVNGDILFCMLKNIISQTSRFHDLKIVIMSASMDIDHFTSFWRSPQASSAFGAHGRALKVSSLHVRGRENPVSIKYLTAPIRNYVRGAVEVSMQIILMEIAESPISQQQKLPQSSQQSSDILIFCTGQQEIEEAYKLLCHKRLLIPKYLRKVVDFIPLKLYGGMTKEEQATVVSSSAEIPSHTARKIIVSSNIAETSLTIPGVSYVIDTGFVKQKWYNSSTNTEELRIVPVSKAQAIQRAGRAGRIRAGTCYRLYTEDYFWNEMESFARPEMTRCSPLGVVLHLKSIGITDVQAFDFIDPPSPSALARALENLHLMSAIDRCGKITAIGKLMAQIPLEPMAARTLIWAMKSRCAKTIEIVATILSMLSIDSIFMDNSTEGHAGESRYLSARKHSVEGDLYLYYDLLLHFRRLETHERRQWCRIEHLRYAEMNKALKIRSQLLNESQGLDSSVPRAQATAVNISDTYRNVREAFCAGYFSQVASWDAKKRSYIHVATGEHVHLVHTSVLSESKVRHELVLFGSLLLTTKNYIRDVIVVSKENLENVMSRSLLS